ncbi:hypothetical protein YK56LOC_38880 [Caballeronia sp. HLA56]
MAEGNAERVRDGTQIDRMRSYYYDCMTNTAMSLIAVASVLVSICALLVAIVA